MLKLPQSIDSLLLQQSLPTPHSAKEVTSWVGVHTQHKDNGAKSRLSVILPQSSRHFRLPNTKSFGGLRNITDRLYLSNTNGNANQCTVWSYMTSTYSLNINSLTVTVICYRRCINITMHKRARNRLLTHIVLLYTLMYMKGHIQRNQLEID